MIVGNGLIAKAFASSSRLPETMIFASGVSNSNEADARAFDRERVLLSGHLDTFHGLFVYFSTCSINDADRKDSGYVQHKLRMENLVQQSERYLIFRLPQLVGHTPNAFTLTNFIYNKILNEQPFTVWARATRSLIDIDDVSRLCSHVIEEKEVVNRIIDICPPLFLTIPEIVKTFENVLGRLAHCDVVDRGSQYLIDTSETEALANATGTQFNSDYPEILIRKYYAPTR